MATRPRGHWTTATLLSAIAVAVLASACLASGVASAAKPEKRPAEPAAPPAAPATLPAAATPADLNDLSLRVAALATLYELDLSPDQIKAVRDAAAAGAADRQPRAAAKGTPALAQALTDLHAALLKGDDADRVIDLREKVAELQDDEGVDLDDDVRPTDAARGKAAGVVRRLKASQLAAYLAEHADEVGDPVELMVDTLAQVRDAGPEDDPDGDIRQTADEVGGLVAGLDAAKAKQVAEQVAGWLKAGRELKDAEYAARSAALEESAKRIVGDVPPTTVLAHWVENEVAGLLSNPQLPAAADAMLAARAKGN